MLRTLSLFALLLLGSSVALVAQGKNPASTPPLAAAAPDRGAPADSPAASASNAPATFSLINDREPMVSLDGQWRFQFGDDPRWADPHFDDSGWALVNSEEDWNENGYAGLTGVAWYRFRVTLPAGEEPYSLRLPAVRTCYQLFADGRLILEQGSMPPRARMFFTQPAVVELSDEPRAQPQTITLALRVWHASTWRRYVAGGLNGSAVVGRSDLINAQFTDRSRARLWNYSDLFDLGALEILGFVIALAFFLSRQSEEQFLWFGLLVLGAAGNHLANAWQRLEVSPVGVLEWVKSSFTALFLASSLLFFQTFLKGKRTHWFKFALLCCALWYLNNLASNFGWNSVSFENLLELVFTLPIYLWIYLLVRRRARERWPDSRLLRGPVTVLFGSLYYSQLIWTIQTIGDTFLSNFEIDIKKPFFLTLNDIAEAFFLLAMLAILLRHTARTRQEQDRVTTELEAARSVQQVLVPESLPPTPGLAATAAYFPAEEVGGDFFQILPVLSGDTLLVIGDVAGKGLPAALTVSLMVGTLRALADYTESPAEILTGLNRRLRGRGTGFTTCLALRFSADGTLLTFANAGHLSPYVNGFELRTEPNLPLGIVPETEYTEAHYKLSPGDRVTVLTDGVPEAKNGHELFGFDRTGAWSRHPAAQIAAAARSFGQNDDITVLTVDVVPLTAAEPLASTPELQPA